MLLQVVFTEENELTLLGLDSFRDVKKHFDMVLQVLTKISAVKDDHHRSIDLIALPPYRKSDFVVLCIPNHLGAKYEVNVS